MTGGVSSFASGGLAPGPTGSLSVSIVTIWFFTRAPYLGGGVVVPLPFLPFLPPLWPFLPPLWPFLLPELVFAALLEPISPPAGWVMESAANDLIGELPGATPGAATVDPRRASNT